jgi:hypothetical protein
MPQKLHLTAHTSNILSTGTSSSVVVPPSVAKIPEAAVVVRRRKLLFPLNNSPHADLDRNRKSDITGETPLRV